MKATGIIVEYNPFHNGHRLHAQASRESTGADVVVAVMSGHFLQRGEPAFLDKWTRTEMALKNGVDLVIELPYAFSTGHAPLFAKGAIHLLDALLCDAYCFGSEAGKIQPFLNSMALLQKEHTAYDQFIRAHVQKGNSYPNALNTAYQSLIRQHEDQGPFIDLTQPNNILGFHYIEAAHQLGSPMQAATIQRVGAGYHDDQFTHQQIGSATSIRKHVLKDQSMAGVKNYLPVESFALLAKQFHKERHFGDWALFYPYLRMTILRETPERLAEIADVTEGIEHVIYRAAFEHEHFEDFMAVIKSKRYTWTRLQRMFTHIFTGYTYVDRQNIQAPSYLRLLGMNDLGRAYLNQKKKNFTLPLLTKVSKALNHSVAIDIRSTNLYAMGMGRNDLMNRDHRQAPIYLRTIE